MAKGKEGAGSEGTGGRGSLSTLPDLESIMLVEEGEELSSSTSPPSPYAPYIERARENPGRRMEVRDRVQATDEAGTPLVELDGETPVWATEENGTPITAPRTFKKSEAQEFYDGLRAAGNRAKLNQKGFSLRIPTQPALNKASDADDIRLQWYVLPMKSGQAQAQPQTQPQS